MGSRLGSRHSENKTLIASGMGGKVNKSARRKARKNSKRNTLRRNRYYQEAHGTRSSGGSTVGSVRMKNGLRSGAGTSPTVMKSRRIEQTKIRQAARDQRSPKEQLALLDRRLGKNTGADNERERLHNLLKENNND